MNAADLVLLIGQSFAFGAAVQALVLVARRGQP